jgi:GT2 family glycosyltransferase
METILLRWPGTWVLLINNDAVLLAGGLKIMREALRKNKETKLVVPRINHAGVIRGAIYYQRWTGLLFERNRAGCFAYPCGCCLMVAPERLRLPLLDERFFMYGEDCELGYRLSKPSDILYLNQILVSHEGSASSGLGSEFYEERIVASHFLMVEILTNSKVIFFIYIVGRFFALSLRAIVRAFRYKSLIPIKSLWHGMLIALVKDHSTDYSVS